MKVRHLAVIFLLLCITTLYAKPNYNRDFIIVGQNGVQKITYITSSCYSEIFRGVRALDSDKNTSWVSLKSESDQWFLVDFGIKRIMTSIVLHPGTRDNYRTLKYFILQLKYNGKWFDFKKVTIKRKFFKSDEKAVVNLGGIDASMFRIYIPRDATYKGYAAISEIETFIGMSKIKYFDPRLKGLYLPVKNGFLPEDDYSYPNAPRKYRGGRHVGLDIYLYHTDDSYEPCKVTKDTPIYSSADGVVVRADWDYKPMSAAEWKQRSHYFKRHPRTFVKRSFGGVQIWIDHQNGVLTTYNHLSKIDPKIKVGTRVKRGQRIGWAGNSGLFGEAEGKNYGVHLHYEIWVDGYYLGHGMHVKDVKKYMKWIFFPLQ